MRTVNIIVKNIIELSDNLFGKFMANIVLTSPNFEYKKKLSAFCLINKSICSSFTSDNEDKVYFSPNK